MVVEITNVSVIRAMKVAALIGFFISSLLAVFFAANILLTSYAAGSSAVPQGLVSAIGLPVMLLLGIAYGGAFGGVAALCYNFVAGRWGGVLVTTREVLREATRSGGAGVTLATVEVKTL